VFDVNTSDLYQGFVASLKRKPSHQLNRKGSCSVRDSHWSAATRAAPSTFNIILFIYINHHIITIIKVKFNLLLTMWVSGFVVRLDRCQQ